MKTYLSYRSIHWLMLSIAVVLLVSSCSGTAAPQAVGAPGSAPTSQVARPTGAQPATSSAVPQAAGTALPTAPATDQPSAGGSKPIRLGASLALSGPFGPTGQWVERGYRHWAEEMNKKGGLLGRRVELTIMNDGGVPDTSVANLKQLIITDSVDLLLGGYPGSTVAAQMAVAEQYKKVYVSMGGHMASFTRGYTYSFGAPPLMGQWWFNGVWDWMKTLPPEQRPRKAAMITINNPIGSATLESIYPGLKELGIEIVVDEKFDPPLKDATPLVQKAKDAGADLFISNSALVDGITTAQAMKALDYNPRFALHAIGTQIPDWSLKLKQDGDYFLSGTPLHEKLPFPGMKELTEVVEKKFNLKGVGTRYQRRQTVPQYFLFGYAWAQMLQRGVEGAGSFDDTAIRDYLHSHEVQTIAGSFKFDERGLPPPRSYVVQVIDGKAELVWPNEVKSAEIRYPKPPWTK